MVISFGIPDVDILNPRSIRIEISSNSTPGEKERERGREKKDRSGNTLHEKEEVDIMER